MAIKINEENFSNLMFPPDNSVLIGIDSSDGQLKVLNSNGEIEVIQKVPLSGATGESIIIGSVIGSTGNYYLGHGREVTPSGNYAHASGYRTIASGNHSHTSGYYTIASGLYSYSGGIGIEDHEVIASGIGSYNYSFTNVLGSSNNAANYGVILGGLNNSMSNTADYSIIVGGHNNDISSTYGVIVGGYENTITGNNVVMLAGKNFLGAQNDSVYVPNLVLAITGATGYSEPGTLIYDGTNFKGRNNSTWVTLESPTSTQVSNWDTAYSWGNHATVGYVTNAGGSNGQVLFNSNGAFGGTTFTYHVTGNGNYLDDGGFRISTLGTNIHGITKGNNMIAGFNSMNQRFLYGGGVQIAPSSGEIYIPNNLLQPDNNTPNHFITYNGMTITKSRPTTLEQYGITDATTNITSNIEFDTTVKDPYISINDLFGRKMGKINFITGVIILSNDGADKTDRAVANINSFVSPGYPVYFALSDNNVYGNARGYVNVYGNIRVNWGVPHWSIWYFNAMWIEP